jgi:hypothetical protein
MEYRYTQFHHVLSVILPIVTIKPIILSVIMLDIAYVECQIQCDYSDVYYS